MNLQDVDVQSLQLALLWKEKTVIKKHMGLASQVVCWYLAFMFVSVLGYLIHRRFKDRFKSPQTFAETTGHAKELAPGSIELLQK